MQIPVRCTTSLRHGICRRTVVVLCVALAILALAGSAFAEPPNLILSDANLRAWDSMSAAEIQAYLDKQPGPLKSLVTSDYDKVITLSKTTDNTNTTPDISEANKRASLIIWEACQAWHINPKVMLTMLQKEQSLLTRTSLTSTTLSRAIGAGCPGSLVDSRNNSVATNRYPGFGNQMWHGARLLDGYGEGKNGSTIALYTPGMYVWDIYLKPNVKVYPGSLATYKLYVYNPSIGGNTSFWNIYVGRFGDPVGDPIIRPIHRFFNIANGSHFYTASSLERYTVATTLSKAYRYEGISYLVDTADPANSTPLYRFFNRKNGTHFYTASAEERDSVKTRLSSTYKYEGIAYNVSPQPAPGALTVHRFFNRKNGTHFYTASATERDSVQKNLSAYYKYEGIAYYAMP